MTARFLFNETLWSELTSRIPKCKVQAAVAYLSSGGGKLLPLKKGDRLVVDMSLKTVRAGVTDPREVEKLLRRGVEVYSRESLHAKFFVLGKALIAGSANGSQSSRDRLDEAAILTTDPRAVAHASATFAEMCNEPVRHEYLKICLDAYRPPRFVPGPVRPTGQRVGNVWILAGLEYEEPPESEAPAIDRVVRKVEKKRADFEHCEVETIHFPREMTFFERLRVGDWVVPCVAHGTGYDVYPPCQLLERKSYARGNGKRRHLLLCESPRDAKPVRWSVFRNSVGARSLPAGGKKPRTAPIADAAAAYRILGLWDVRGRFRGKKT